MQINISGHHVDISPSLRDYVTNKLDRLNRHHDHITNTDVTLIVDKLEQKAEATVHVSGADLFANSVSTDMYAAIDSLTDKLDRQLIKYKEKLRNHR
ncbi:MAG: ribosome-associated translation inhibitor RaiA [Pseudomonadales bacterium]|nr:ribosome-associated translation inhibitor RaiA [Pseudomonadales bacterium]